ncbi:MAG: hypothetical protein RLZ98_1474 [Pseudomonadota bacterium]
MARLGPKLKNASFPLLIVERTCPATKIWLAREDGRRLQTPQTRPLPIASHARASPRAPAKGRRPLETFARPAAPAHGLPHNWRHPGAGRGLDTSLLEIRTPCTRHSISQENTYPRILRLPHNHSHLVSRRAASGGVLTVGGGTAERHARATHPAVPGLATAASVQIRSRRPLNAVGMPQISARGGLRPPHSITSDADDTSAPHPFIPGERLPQISGAIRPRIRASAPAARQSTPRGATPSNGAMRRTTFAVRGAALWPAVILPSDSATGCGWNSST